MSEQPNLVKDHGLEHFALGRLSTRESLVREIQRRVRADLRAEENWPGRLHQRLNGPLGESIAIQTGSWVLDGASPEEIAEGICTWLDQTFLNKPLQGFGPRDGNEDPSPPPSSEGADGSRVGTLVHLPTLIRQEFEISASEARRLIHQGGVAVNGERLSPDEFDLPFERIDGAQLRIGRRRAKRVDLKEAS